MTLDDVGTYTLQVRSSMRQAGESQAARTRREALVVALLLTPAVLGLLVSSSSRRRSS